MYVGEIWDQLLDCFEAPFKEHACTMKIEINDSSLLTYMSDNMDTFKLYLEPMKKNIDSGSADKDYEYCVAILNDMSVQVTNNPNFSESDVNWSSVVLLSQISHANEDNTSELHFLMNVI